MNGRLRPAPAALAAAATIGVGLPLHALFAPPLWMLPSTLAVLLVGLTGVGLRSLTRAPALVAAGQLIVGTWAVLLALTGHTTWYGLPNARTFRAVGEAAAESVVAITDQAAPVEVTPGVAMTLSLVLVVVAVIVDLLAVTLRMPAAAGLPLLTAYVAGASNSGTGLSFVYFVLPAAAWTGMLGHDGVARFRRWSASVARPRGGSTPEIGPGLLAWARTAGLAALVAAIVLPGVIPHLPPTFVADGLGRADTGRGGGGNSLNDTLEVTRNLLEQSTEPMFSYRTDDPAPPPLRVDALASYSDGVWTRTSAQAFDTGGEFPASLAGPAVTRRSPTSVFRDNELASPQLALPGTPLALDVEPEGWRLDANGIVRTLRQVDNYEVRYEEATPTPAQLRASDPLTAGDAQTLAIDGPSSEYVRTVLDEVAPPELAPIDAAWRIQAHLRSAQYTYSMELAPPRATDDEGRPVPSDPISQFLATRRGYCIQFSTAMAMMARHRGIPARVAIGFLPGQLDGDTRTVRAADAHAWPELLFPGVGWVRFEPTPGIRSGAAPGWSTDNTTTTPTASPSPSTSASSAAPSEEADPTAATPGTQGPGAWLASAWSWLVAHRGLLLGGLVVLVLLAATPVAGLVRRRLALRRARDEAERTEVIWASLIDRLGDIGVSPGVGDTPRQAGEALRRGAYLDAESVESLHTVVATLERARYARPGTDLVDVGPDAERVVRTAHSRRRPTDRLRARLWPREGRRAWEEALGSFTRSRRSDGSDQSR